MTDAKKIFALVAVAYLLKSLWKDENAPAPVSAPRKAAPATGAAAGFARSARPLPVREKSWEEEDGPAPPPAVFSHPRSHPAPRAGEPPCDGFDIVAGASIAVGLGQVLGAETHAAISRNPQVVLENLKKIPGSIEGKCLLLSTGVSNGYTWRDRQGRDMLDVYVPQQLDYLASRGAHVVVVGTGPGRDDAYLDLMFENRLFNETARRGFVFAGGFSEVVDTPADPSRAHPKSYPALACQAWRHASDQGLMPKPPARLCEKKHRTGGTEPVHSR